jgi:hypothetical protein
MAVLSRRSPGGTGFWIMNGPDLLSHISYDSTFPFDSKDLLKEKCSEFHLPLNPSERSVPTDTSLDMSLTKC